MLRITPAGYNPAVRVGISGLAVGNGGGLGRLARTSIIALAAARPDWELHIYLRARDEIATLHAECGAQYADVLDRATVHLPPPAWRHRLVLEEIDLPRQFTPLKLDSYLGLDFTLPRRQLAPVEAVLLPDLLPFTQPKSVSLRARVLYRRGIKRALQRGARLICISEKTRQQLLGYDRRDGALSPPEVESASRGRQGGPPAVVIHPALSPSLLELAGASAVHDRPLQVRGTLASLTVPGPYLLYVGDCGPRKNVPLLVGVYRSMVEDGQYAGSLVLVGGNGRHCTDRPSGKLVLETVGQAAVPVAGSQAGTPAPLYRQPHIYDLGRVSDSDLSELYANADLLVNLSSEEGFGYPVLEAIAHGTPAVVTKGSAMQEAAPAGVVQTSLDPDSAAQTIASALTALPLLRQEVHAIDRGWFNIERMGKQLAEVLEK
jgi:glycosyltransferase involved in cell wall biosynthesis